ncbi:SusD/RagB family nutrient-binding outer membrane lipoprotein [Flavobacterium psychroterrae]|uniref:SusD/RagB family nutrient-binding outer membrane lipoprotein n=1 Tax=Flavobacterium psychroterrae TaxID=2133767 RepID=A0ABS5PCZ7_9FLAO|nr:SusD/RagB family nutrient-binding outer membrane lipoprotein [Flavobacterium psychroterrae]MBS7231991.1 SusD/RagB family nutrient-binding outer membrane lipoprotein [Flavobacterium psychroterrae]
MKKYIKSIILAAFSISLLTGCQTELDDFNDNPNNPSTSNPSLLVAAMEVSTFQTHTSGLTRNAGIFTQHLAGTNVGQMGEIARYIVTEQDVNNEWNTLYQTTLMNGHILNRDFAKDYPWYNGIGQVLTALNLGYATDMWGDIPYDEAFLAAEGNKNPKYNTQQEIYERIQTLLDKAIVNLSQPEDSNEEIPEDADFIFNGDTEKWTKVAYVLKARFALRLTNVEGSTVAAQKALDYITKADMTANSDDANTYFPGTANSFNQWYAFNVSRANYLKVGKYFVDYLQNNNDPRLSFMIAKNIPPKGSTAPAIYIGNSAEDQASTGTSYIGPKYASANSSIGIVTFAEAKFIEAEAKARLGQPSAQVALQEAVTASVTKITGSAPSATFLGTATATFDVANIIQQKYLALFLTMEPYNDYRRTGFPALTPNKNSNTKLIPVRLPTPSDERQYNTNATVVSNVTTKVWWDKD